MFRTLPTASALPPQMWFVISALFHYLGPAFAVLLFPAVGVLGVAFLRIASAAVVFALIGRPVHVFLTADRSVRLTILGLGVCLAVMNSAFYLALERLPMSLVASMEFVATTAVALWGLRSRRNAFALGFTVLGVMLLIDIRWVADPIGLAWSALNALLFALYVVLAHRLAQTGAGDGIGSGVAGLGASMAVAAIVSAPFGVATAASALSDPRLILAGIGVGLCSSVIPYVCDQFALARLPRASFAMMLALLPATATAIGALVLAQWPSALDCAGVALVMAGVACHRSVQSKMPQ